MRITLITVGKTASKDIKAVCDDYAGRISRYVKFSTEIVENSSIRSTDVRKVKEKEGELLLKRLAPADHVILLDDKGKDFTSEGFAGYMQKLLNQSHKNICFVVGGAYGFSDEVYARANSKLSLSKMTFSHQIIRAIFAEQLYRAFTIINNEPYHHQ